MHANRLMPNVYRKKLLAFTINCFEKRLQIMLDKRKKLVDNDARVRKKHVHPVPSWRNW